MTVSRRKISHMSSIDDQPVTPSIRYAVHVHDLDGPFEVECDDIKEDGTYIRFYSRLLPVAVVPAAQLVAFHRTEATA